MEKEVNAKLAMNTELLPNMPCLVKGHQFVRGGKRGRIKPSLDLHPGMIYFSDPWLFHGFARILNQTSGDRFSNGRFR